jgi:hypothetical protein
MGCVAEIGDPMSLAEAISNVLGQPESFKGDPAHIAGQYDPISVAASYEALFERLRGA